MVRLHKFILGYFIKSNTILPRVEKIKGNKVFIKSREGGDIVLFINLVPKVLK